MIAEYALDPALLSNWADFRFYVSQFGGSQGRLISEFPAKWKRMVRDHAEKSAQDREFLKITEALARLDREMMVRDHVYDGIQEYDQKLPNWWLFTWYITMVWFVIAWLAYYQFGVGRTDHEAVSSSPR